MIKKIKHLLSGFPVNKKLNNIQNQNNKILSELANQRLLFGRHLANNLKGINAVENIHDAEFKIFSQWGDDGIIQYLIKNIPSIPKIFIEFGVENYTESNTRFLLENNNWTGLIIDSSKENIDYVKNDNLYWKHDLTAVSEFITAENINSIFAKAGFSGHIGILSIDIDGNDYWVWKAIDSVSPDIVIIEYNSLFGNTRPIAVPYTPNFVREEKHWSYLYWGASLPAMYHLAEEKGYSFVGCESHGINAYFVKKELSSKIKPKTLNEAFVQSKFRQARNKDGKLSYISYTEQRKLLEGLPVINTLTGKPEKF